MKKKLVYYLYIGKDFLENPVYKIHYVCLERYLKLFNDISFTIAVDELNNENIIAVKRWVAEKCCADANITFNVILNKAHVREAETFFKEVVDTQEDYDGIVFFGHSKGQTNGQDENLYRWVTALYFFNLEPIEEVEEKFVNYHAMAYGGPIMRYDEMYNKSTKFPYHYSMGTFFWTYMRKIKYTAAQSGAEIPKYIDRYSGENFISDIFDYDKYYPLLATYGGKFLKNFLWFYDNAAKGIELLYKETPLWGTYESFYNNIMEKINNNEGQNIGFFD